MRLIKLKADGARIEGKGITVKIERLSDMDIIEVIPDVNIGYAISDVAPMDKEGIKNGVIVAIIRDNKKQEYPKYSDNPHSTLPSCPIKKEKDDILPQ